MKSKSKQQIIDAAGIIFKRYGFKKTTMDDIASAAGKGKSSIYYYFKNKEDVFEAVTQNEAQILQEGLANALKNKKNSVDKLRTYVNRRMKRFVAKGNLTTALNDNFLATLGFIVKIRDNYREWEIKTIKEILAQGIQDGEFKPVDINFAGEAILTCMIGFEVPLLTKENSLEETEKKINDVIDMFFYGICC